MNQAMVLAQDAIRQAVERPEREKTVPKKLPDTLLCRLLGLSGLGWEDQHLLAPIWLSLHQQPDKTGRGLVLQTFFQDLGEQAPAFSQFRNSTLFDHILTHKFEPGAGYESCHHGISLLAVSMRSFSAQERERKDDDDFELATTKTPEAVRKHSSKAPPPLPTTVAELLQLMWRMIILTTGLFTTDCSLAIQLRDMHQALQKREQTLMGDPEEASALIPQLAWAITSSAREFYGTISTRKDVDPPDNSAPRVAIAQLSIYTQLFKAGLTLNLTNMPDQWRRKNQQQSDTVTTSEKRGGGNGKQESDTSNDKRHGSNPFQAAPNPGKGFKGRHNPNWPPVFNTTAFQQLKDKLSDVTLSDIVYEAGIKGGPSQLTTTGWPSKLCLNWACMGKCPKYKCEFDHPASIDNAVAAVVYRQMEPGIKRLLETGKRPKRE
jgi:hypothetical protein